MIKAKMKNSKGITLVVLSITIIVLLIVTNVVIYTVQDNLKVDKLKSMQNDIDNLKDRVSSYYAQNGKIPAKLRYQNIEKIEQIRQTGVISNTVDTGEFYIIDLAAIENLTLHYGKDFEKVKDLSEAEAQNYQDLYIINESSQNIFYVAGVNLDGEWYYTNYTEDGTDTTSVDLRYIDGVKIPDGFYYVGGTKDTGIVISDVKDDDMNNTKQGNQFVWVPVEDPNKFTLIDGYNNGELQNKVPNTCIEPYDNGYKTEVEEYEQMRKSVLLNHGFYIGRFETGKVNEEAVVRKNVDAYVSIPWGISNTDVSEGAVKKAKDFVNTNYTNKGKKVNVTSNLCYGVQWDATIQFFDSNYYSGTCDDNSVVKYTKGNYDKSLIKTGSNEDYAIKNIYDMAGNAGEMTMEYWKWNCRTVRGGHCWNSNTVSCSTRESRRCCCFVRRKFY